MRGKVWGGGGGVCCGAPFITRLALPAHPCACAPARNARSGIPRLAERIRCFIFTRSYGGIKAKVGRRG